MTSSISNHFKLKSTICVHQNFGVCTAVTPAPVCRETQQSVFSVTGFLTFAVVASTAVANVINNIDNNNNRNNNNDNNDNLNDNNQMSDSTMVMNNGNAKSLKGEKVGLKIQHLRLN